MRIVITSQSMDRLEEALTFYQKELEIPADKVAEIKTQLLNRVKILAENPHIGQYEPYLKKLKKGHRRLIEGNFKIIYRIEGEMIYITDFFDSRKNPSEMQD